VILKYDSFAVDMSYAAVLAERYIRPGSSGFRAGFGCKVMRGDCVWRI